MARIIPSHWQAPFQMVGRIVVRRDHRVDPFRITFFSTLLGRAQTGLGAFYRRLAARIGKAQAVTATARKLAILLYRTQKGEIVYRDAGADTYDAHERARVLRRLRERAKTLGFDLVNCGTGEAIEAAVS